MDNAAHDAIFCHRCSRQLTPGEGNFYVVRIEAVADPTPPQFGPDSDREDFSRRFGDLVEEIGRYSEGELMDQIYRRMTIHLCRRCYETWIEDPTA
jgi:hypothetical protein